MRREARLRTYSITSRYERRKGGRTHPALTAPASSKSADASLLVSKCWPANHFPGPSRTPIRPPSAIGVGTRDPPPSISVTASRQPGFTACRSVAPFQPALAALAKDHWHRGSQLHRPEQLQRSGHRHRLLPAAIAGLEHPGRIQYRQRHVQSEHALHLALQHRRPGLTRCFSGARGLPVGRQPGEADANQRALELRKFRVHALTVFNHPNIMVPGMAPMAASTRPLIVRYDHHGLRRPEQHQRPRNLEFVSRLNSINIQDSRGSNPRPCPGSRILIGVHRRMFSFTGSSPHSAARRRSANIPGSTQYPQTASPISGPPAR